MAASSQQRTQAVSFSLVRMRLQMQRMPGFLQALLHTVSEQSFPQSVRHASTVSLRNFVDRNWARQKASDVEFERDAIYSPADKQVVRDHIINVAATVEEKTFLAQLAATITEICVQDFPVCAPPVSQRGWFRGS